MKKPLSKRAQIRKIQEKGRNHIIQICKEKARKLPEMKDENGNIQNHYQNLKRQYTLRGIKGINAYLKECRRAVRQEVWRARMLKLGIFLHLISIKKINETPSE